MSLTFDGQVGFDFFTECVVALGGEGGDEFAVAREEEAEALVSDVEGRRLGDEVVAEEEAEEDVVVE